MINGKVGRKESKQGALENAKRDEDWKRRWRKSGGMKVCLVVFFALSQSRNIKYLPDLDSDLLLSCHT